MLTTNLLVRRGHHPFRDDYPTWDGIRFGATLLGQYHCSVVRLFPRDDFHGGFRHPLEVGVTGRRVAQWHASSLWRQTRGVAN